jgi:spore maturation protein SpmB
MVTIDTFKRGFGKGFKTLFDLLKLLAPVYIAIELLSISGLLNIIADICNPVMSVFGLPGETSLTLIIGYFTGIYGALGTLAAIKLTPVQATTIGIMLSTAHNLIGEAAVVKKLGVSASLSVGLRIFFSLFLGFAFFRIFG